MAAAHVPLEMSFDPVMVVLFDKSVGLPEQAAHLFRLYLRLLWISRQIEVGDDHNLDALMAALVVNTETPDGYVDFDSCVEKFGEQMNLWIKEVDILREQIKVLSSHGPAHRKLRNHLKHTVMTHSGQELSNEDKKSVHCLTLMYYDFEAERLYNPPVQSLNPFTHFRISIVTWIKNCGGHPKVEEKHDIPLSTSWDQFQKILTEPTRNAQMSALGYPDGLSCEHGDWMYQVMTRTTPTPYELKDAQQYKNMIKDTTVQDYRQYIRIIHEKIQRVPRVIEARHTSDESQAVEEDDQALRLPIGFHLDFEYEGLDVAEVHARLKEAQAASARKVASIAASSTPGEGRTTDDIQGKLRKNVVSERDSKGSEHEIECAIPKKKNYHSYGVEGKEKRKMAKYAYRTTKRARKAAEKVANAEDGGSMKDARQNHGAADDCSQRRVEMNEEYSEDKDDVGDGNDSNDESE